MGWELITPDSLADLDSSQNTKLGGISTDANKTTFPSNTTEGQFSFNIDGTTTTNDVFSSGERTKLNRLRLGQAPDDAAVSIKNNAITISKNGSAVRLNNAGGFGDISFSSGDVGLGNVPNYSAATMRAGTTATDVGLSNVPNYSAATMMSQNLTGTIGGVSNSTVRSGAAAGATANQDSTANIRAGTTKTNVGLENVSNNAQVRQDLVGAPNAIKNAQITTNSNGTLNNAGGGTAPNIDDIADSGSTKSGATRANNAIDSSYRIVGNIWNGTSTISAASVHSGATRANSVIDSSNRFVGNIWNGTSTISAASVHSGASRANTGLDSNGDLDRAVPLGKLSNLNTYSVDNQVVTWSKISNAGYTPSGTSQTINISWKRASDGVEVCTSRWVPTINTTSNTINTVAGTPNVTGSGCTAGTQTGTGSTFSTVTFTRGGVSVTVTAKINVLSGFTFKSE